MPGLWAGSEVVVPGLWAGSDAGGAGHHCVVFDADGRRRLSRCVGNGETVLLKLIADVLELSDGAPVAWAIDLNAGGAVLVIALLTDYGQRLFFIPGRTVRHACGSCRGEGKSDAKDAFVIGGRARVRRGLEPVHRGEGIAVGLRILTSRRLDLAAGRTRAISRFRARMLEYFPALEGAFGCKTFKAALVLLAQYQTPAALRRIGKARLATWLKNRKAGYCQLVAATAVGAGEARHTAVTGGKPAAAVVARLVREVMALDEEIAETDALIEGRFRDRPHAEVILSRPGLGPVLGAGFIADTGGDVSIFASADRLAGVAGLAPVPKASGRISGSMRRPRRCCRRLLRVFCMSAVVAACSCPVFKAFYERKRAEGKGHRQAITALARRRLNVLWALIRDGRPFGLTAPQAPVPLG